MNRNRKTSKQMSQPSPNPPTTTTHNDERKPRISLAIATAFGLGYLPKAPGTFGSLGGVALTALYWSSWLPEKPLGRLARDIRFSISPTWIAIAVTVIVSVVGVAAGTATAKYVGVKDPQIVVIDEVS